jgi:cyclophilin family peptidyl-prolyl cis-trans isomerase
VRFPRTLAAAVLVGAAALAADAAEGDLVLEASLETKSLKLGEDAVLVLTLTNRTASAVKVPSLRLARDSVSVRVAGAHGTSTVARLYGSFLENGTGGLDFRPEETTTRQIAPGASLSGKVAVPALLAGTLTFTAVLGDGGKSKVEAKPVAAEVVGRQRAALQVETTKGPLRIELDAAAAYGSAATFWTLAKEGFFDGLPFHRVVTGALAQTGDPRGNGTGGPGWYVPGETVVTASARGDVGLARGAHADSAGSQWFVVAGRNGEIAGGYVRIGTVADGLDTIDLLAANVLDAKSGRPKTPDKVLSARTVLR